MNRHWLPWLAIGGIGVIVLVLFALRLRPVWTPEQAAPAATSVKIDRPTVTFVNPSVGPANAKVTIVEFGDFQCGACADELAALRAVQAAFPKDVRLAWKHLPNPSLHPLATPAAVAAQCAQQQGKFWPFADALFQRQSSLTTDQFPQIAQEVGLNARVFASCFDAQDSLPVVQKDAEEGTALGITSTPTVFVNGDRYVGAQSIEELTGYVNAILAH